jgi:hypothetical protein
VLEFIALIAMPWVLGIFGRVVLLWGEEVPGVGDSD